jgi:hypothetical protein
MLEAAAETGVQVMWDLFHYGSPDHLDQGSAEFVPLLRALRGGGGRLHREVTGTAAIVCPLNEMSFLAWAARNGVFRPIGPDEDGWLSRHLVSTAVAGMRAMRDVDPDCRFIWAEPLINVRPPPRRCRGGRGQEAQPVSRL